MKIRIVKTLHRVHTVLLPLFLVTLLLMGGCKKDAPSAPDPPDPETKIPSTTKVVSAADYTSKFVSVSADSTTFIFQQGASSIDNLRVNDILVSNKGFGILRKVTAVTSLSGQITVQTSRAAITDALEKGSIALTRTLSPADTLRTEYSAPGVKLKPSRNSSLDFSFELTDVVIADGDENLQTTNDQTVANGDITASFTFTFDMRIDNWRVQTATISTTVIEQMNLRIQTQLLNRQYAKEKVLRTWWFNPIVIQVGFLPVIITPKLSLVVGVDAQVFARLESSISQSTNVTTGLTYSAAINDWTPFRNETHSFNFQPPTITLGASLKGYVGSKLDFFLYGIVGPKATLQLYGKVNADLTQTPWLTFIGGIEGKVGVEVEIFSHVLARVEKTVLDLRTTLYQSSTLPGGTITGSVKDALTNVPLSNVRVDVFQDASLVSTAFSTTNGSYEVIVPASNGYRVVFSKTLYLETTYNNVNVTAGQTVILEAILQINQTYSGIGTIVGTIKNALDGTGITGVALKLRAGLNATSGTVVASTTSNTSGVYSFANIQAGNYTVEANRSGFNVTYFSVLCLGGQSQGGQDGTMTPILGQGETRIVLTWGAQPPDLDSHLTGPLQSGGRFHMYYPYKGSASPWPTIVNLDLDDITSYGPETTTLYQQITGVHRFSVHDYTNRNSTSSYALSNSSAQVRVYKSTGLVATFNVPPNAQGTLWTVFEMDGGTITPINTMSYVPNPADVTRPANHSDADLLRKLPSK